jgi:hypothetical protein
MSEMGKWSNAKEVRARISEHGLRKDPACSWMEIGNNAHTFTARDHSHRDAERIHLKLIFSVGAASRSSFLYLSLSQSLS